MNQKQLSLRTLKDKIKRNDYNFTRYDLENLSDDVNSYITEMFIYLAKDENKDLIKKLIDAGVLQTEHLRDVPFERVDLSGTGIGRILNPQIIKDKTLDNVDLTGENLSWWPKEYLVGVRIWGSKFRSTGIGKVLDIKVIKGKSLQRVDLTDEDLSHITREDLKGACLWDAELSGTGIGKSIYPKELYEQSIQGIDLTNENLSHLTSNDLEGTVLYHTILKGTGIGKAINPKILKVHNLHGVDLTGEDLSHLTYDNFAKSVLTDVILTDSNANIDLNYLLGTENFRYASLIGCNIIGNPYKVMNINHNTFDEKYKNAHPQYFVSDDVPDEIKKIYYSDAPFQEDHWKYRGYYKDKLWRGGGCEKYLVNALGVELTEELVDTFSFDYLNHNITRGWSNQVFAKGYNSQKFIEYYLLHKEEILRSEFDLKKLAFVHNVLVSIDDKDIRPDIDIDDILPKASFLNAYARILGDIQFDDEYKDMKVYDIKNILSQAIIDGVKLDENYIKEYIKKCMPQFANSDDPIKEVANLEKTDKILEWYRIKREVPVKYTETYLEYYVPEEKISEFNLKEFRSLINNSAWNEYYDASHDFFFMYTILGSEDVKKFIIDIPEYVDENSFNSMSEHKLFRSECFQKCIIIDGNIKKTYYKIINPFKSDTSELIQELSSMQFDTAYQHIINQFENMPEIKNYIKKHLNNLLKEDSDKKYSQAAHALEQLFQKKNNSIMYQILSKYDIEGALTPQVAHEIFDGMKCVYDERFKDYILNNIKVLINNPDYRPIMKNIQEEFDKLVDEFKTSNFTLQEAKRFFEEVMYINIIPGNEELALKAKNCGYIQRDFETLQSIHQASKKRTSSSIPQISGVHNGYTYRMLDLDDPLNLLVGRLTGCCYDLDRAAHSSMVHGATEPNGRVFVIEKDGNILAQSWVWRNGGVVCFDNVETSSRGKDISNSNILDVYKIATNKLVNCTNEKLKELLAKHIIDKEQYKNLTINKITVGIGHSDIADEIEKQLSPDSNIVKPIELYVSSDFGSKTDLYISDSQSGQYILYQNKKYTPNRSYNKLTLPLFKDEIFTELQSGDDITRKTIQNIREIERIAYPESMRMLQLAKYSNDVGRQFEILNKRLNIAGNKDWYIVFEQLNNGQFSVCDLAKRPVSYKVDSESVINKVNKLYEDSIRTQMYEYLQRTFAGKTITCQSRTETSLKMIERLAATGEIEILHQGKPEPWYKDESIKMVDVVLKVIPKTKNSGNVKKQRNSANIIDYSSISI